MKNRQQGFTMIELIMVIVILGVLAAVALPKFYDMQADARMAKMNAALGAIKSASAIGHSAYLMAGTSPTSVTLEGSSVPLLNGYPDVKDPPATSGIAIAAGGLSDYSLSVATGSVLTVAPDSSHSACVITYTEAGSGATPTIVSSAITSDNCD